MRKGLRPLGAGSATALAGWGAPALGQSLDERINQGFAQSTGWFVEFIFGPLPGTDIPWIVLWLIVAAVVFTIYFGAIQIRAFALALRIVAGRYTDPQDKGEVNHFQALTAALSGTVGLGNIAGVAVAVSIGGAGATFWMILAGLLGMATKFTECTLGVKYRNEYADGTVSGGPMYYLSKGFAERGLPGGQVLAVTFSVFCIMGALGAGNMFQANQAHSMIASLTGGYPGWMTGTVLAIVVFAVIAGGIKSIARVTEKVVPFMALIYIGAALVILFVHRDMLLWAFGQIIEGAFTGLGVAGGIVGALIQGFRRAAFSNEAGLGSAAIAHSAVRTREPVTEGFVALLEPFIDTVVICTMTALVIIITGQLMTDAATGQYVLTEAGRIATATGVSGGVELTSAAFASVIGWFPNVLVVAVVLFAFSTMLTWSYYGMKAWTYLCGEGRGRELLFKAVFCLCIVVGAGAELDPVINFSDAAIFSMGLINVIGLYLLMPVVKRELHSFLARLKSGEIRRYR